MAGYVDPRRKGVYYTPGYIARMLCKECIARYIARRLEIPMVDAERFVNIDSFRDLPAAVKSRVTEVDMLLRDISIIDPAAGQGIMLVSMLEEIAQARLHVHHAIGQEIEARVIHETVAIRSIFGIDVDADAIDIARKSIVAKIMDFDGSVTPDVAAIIDSHVMAGNSLAEMSELVEHGSFDIVISNPPYLSYYGNAPTRLIETEKNQILQSFELVDQSSQRINSMNLFIELGIKLLKDGGVLAYVVNKTLCVLPSYEKIRAYILGHSTIRRVVIDLDPFDAIVDCALLSITRDPPPSEYMLSWCSLRGMSLDQVPLSEIISRQQVQISITQFTKHKHLEFTYSIHDPILEKMERAGCKMRDILTINRGLNIGGCSQHFLSPIALDGRYRMVIRSAKNVKHYRAWWSADQGFLVFDKVKERSLRDTGKTLVLGDPSRYDGPRLFIPEASKGIRAAYVDTPLYSAYGILVGKSVQGEADLKIACALLNSRAISFYAIEREILRKGKKATPHAGVKGLARLPVPSFDPVARESLVALVDAVLDRLALPPGSSVGIQNTQETRDLMVKIDQIIFASFGLDEMEIRSINETVDSLFK